MGVFFEAHGDAAVVFDPVEEALDAVALFVDPLGEAMLFPAVGFVGDIGCRTLGLDLLAQPIGVVGLVGQEDITLAQAAQQDRGALEVMGLARREGELDRQAAGIDEGVDLGCQSSSRETQTMNSVAFFRLAAC